MTASLEAARVASLQGRHQQAIDLCVGYLQAHPGDPRAIAFLGLSLWRGSAFAEAVEVLSQGLTHFPAQEELSLALLESLYALGRLERAQQIVASLPQDVLDKPAFRFCSLKIQAALVARRPEPVVVEELLGLHEAGEYAETERRLVSLMKAYPSWVFAHTLLASTLFMCSGRDLSSEALLFRDELLSAAELQIRLRQALAAAMAVHRELIEHHLHTALNHSRTDDHARELLARTRFERGERLDDGEMAHLAAQLGSQLLGPFPLRHALEIGKAGVIDARLLEPAGVMTIPEPRSIGTGPLDLTGAVGLALTSDRYVAQAYDAIVSAGSDAILLSDGVALCEPLTHPLGELVRYLSDEWIALGAVSQVVLRAQPVMQLRGTVISMLGAATRFYGHWLLDYLIRLRSVAEHPSAAQACVLVEEGMPESHYEALRLLLGPGRVMKRVALGSCVKVDHLLFAGPEVFFPHATRSGAPLLPSVAPSSASGMAWLREHMLAAVPRASARSGGRLLVRRRSPTRRVLNEEAVRDLLVRDWGFEELFPETLSFAEQVHRFHAADVIVGAQGSAMSNCAFCAPGTQIFSLCSSYAANFPSWAAALEELGMQHCFVVGKTVEASHALPVQRDVIVDLRSLEEALISVSTSRYGH